MSLYVFDKDGTILQFIRGPLGVPAPPLKAREQILVPGVFEKLADLRAAGHRIALASNQTAVAEGRITLEQAQRLMENCVAKIGGVDGWRMSPFSPEAPQSLFRRPNPFARDDPSRKPHPGMVLELMAELGCSPCQTFMIGDKDMDKDAARAAGVYYFEPREFFG